MDSDTSTLQAPLPGLIAAEDRSAYAERHNLQYYDGKVIVEVWLTGNASTVDYPKEVFDPVSHAKDRRVIGRVDVDDLRDLADHETVENLSPRIQPQPT